MSVADPESRRMKNKPGGYAGLDAFGALTAVALTIVRKAGAVIGRRPALNFIEGTNVTLTVADNPTTNAVDVTVAASGGSGSGDVVGPASSTNNDIAVFDGTTGKLLKDGGATIASLVPTTRTVNGHALSSNVTVTASDLSLVIGTNVQAYSAYLTGLAGASQSITADTTLTTQRAQLVVDGSWQITFPTVASWTIGVPTVIVYRGTTEATIILIANAADRIEGAACAALVGTDIIATITPIAANKWAITVDRGIGLWQHAVFDLTTASGASPWTITNSVGGSAVFTDISSVAPSGVAVSTGLVFTAASTTSIGSNASATGGVARTPLSGLTDGWSRPLSASDDFWVLAKSSRTTTVGGSSPNVTIGLCGATLAGTPRVLASNSTASSALQTVARGSATTTLTHAEASTTSAAWTGFEFSGAERKIMEAMLSTSPSGTPGAAAGWWPTLYLSTSRYRWGQDYAGGTVLWSTLALTDLWLSMSNVTTGSKWTYTDFVVLRVLRGRL